MLISFSVENYRSFKDKATFSLVAKTAYKELPQNLIQANKKQALLRSALVYGANASGKSNLFDALELINTVIYSNAENQLISKYYDYYCLEEDMDNGSIRLNYQFITGNGVQYDYEIEFNRDQVVFEALSFKPKGQEAMLFKRRGNEIHFGDYFKNQSIIRSYVERAENAQRLVLIIAGQLAIEYVNAAFQFLSNMEFLSHDDMNFNSEETESELLKRLYFQKSTKWFETYKKLIMALDIGIKDIDIEKQRDKISGKTEYELVTYREKKLKDGSYDAIPFGSYNESFGTLTILWIAEPLIDALILGGVLVVDEIDRSLHPQIVEYFIQLFNNPEINKKNAQLICTTYNAYLMYQEVMRRDQIWIVEKDAYGASQLFSLADVKGLKKEMPFGKYYTSGKLGGTPIIDDLDFINSFYESPEVS